MKSFLTIVLVTCSLLLSAQDAVVRVTADAIKRDYNILFSAPVTYEVEIALLSTTNDVLMEETVRGKAFLKAYSLDKVGLGRFRWRVKYDDKVHYEDFEIKSLKKLMKESISVNREDFKLDINVEDVNDKPMNIFLFNAFGDQIDYVFWEPTLANRTKKIDLSRYDAYEIKLKIVQNGDLAYQEEYKLY